MTIINREKSRLLRQQQTLAEQCLWQQLRNRQLDGYKFHRQYAIGHYIVDFVCRAEKLIVELDGIHHAEVDQAEYDQIRTQFFIAQGYHVLRFWNRDIEASMPSVLDKIHSVLKTLTPQPPLPEVEGEQDAAPNSSLLSPSTSGRGVGVRVSP
jgi:very-short-patch-repair endonuclease